MDNLAQATFNFQFGPIAFSEGKDSFFLFGTKYCHSRLS
jgi:hypothetical protein